MVVEVRTYRLKAGKRDEFVNIFQTRSMPIHEQIGMTIVGPLLGLEDPDVFVFLRGFPSSDQRDRMKAAFYEGPEWVNELEPVLMPMIEAYSVVLTEGTLWASAVRG